MKPVEIKSLRDDELTAEVKRLRKAIYGLRAQSVTEKIKDTSMFRKHRKDLARVLTELSARRKKVTQ